MKEKIKRLMPFVLTVVGFGVYYFFVGCPLKKWFGICCPGCGMSRAIDAALNLDFALAFEYHPLVFLLPVAIIVLIFHKKLSKNALGVLIIIFGVMLIAVYIFRLCSGSDIVFIDFTQGRLYGLFH